MQQTWHPRGEANWPDWKKAKSGQRFKHVRSGRQGTFVRVSPNRHNGAIVDWDSTEFSGGKPVRANVVAPAFDLRPV
jgi:hypothetical protein